MRPDELSFEIHLERRTTKGSSSGRIMRLVPVFILEMHNQMNYRMFAQVRPDKLCVLSIKTVNVKGLYYVCTKKTLPLMSTQLLPSHCRTIICHFYMTSCLANCERSREDKVKEVKVDISLIEKLKNKVEYEFYIVIGRVRNTEYLVIL